jgi:hypothetical protein
MTQRVGRPKADDKRSHRFSVFVTAKEAAAFKRAAERSLDPVPTWLRKLGLRASEAKA